MSVGKARSLRDENFDHDTIEWDIANTVVAQAEQIAAVLALHEDICCEFPESPRWTCIRALKRESDWCPKCRIGRALGVTA